MIESERTFPMTNLSLRPRREAQQRPPKIFFTPDLKRFIVGSWNFTYFNKRVLIP